MQGWKQTRLDGAGSQDDAWSCAASPPRMLLRCDGRTNITRLYGKAGLRRQWDDPLEALHWMAQSVAGDSHGGRWIGYLSYDLGRLFERIPSLAADELGLPLFIFSYHEPDIASASAERIVARQNGGESSRSTEADLTAAVTSNFTRLEYEAAVARVIEYIAAGDIFQVNLSQRFTAQLREPPAEIYRRLQGCTPANFAAFLDYGDHALLCNSPELFIRVRRDHAAGRRHIITRPIKGTRPRAPGMDVELRDSIKDQAELNMIVDLERNDLGRVCEIGSVKVTQPRVIEALPTVYHGVATIEGLLREDIGFVDLLRAVFPGGSITGAPKIRAMQIIEELEPTRRGPYCGAIGWLGRDGAMEFNIAIRTMIVQNGRIHIPVGGGIVADSDPAAEYLETLVKARATFAALGLAPPG